MRSSKRARSASVALSVVEFVQVPLQGHVRLVLCHHRVVEWAPGPGCPGAPPTALADIARAFRRSALRSRERVIASGLGEAALLRLSAQKLQLLRRDWPARQCGQRPISVRTYFQ